MARRLSAAFAHGDAARNANEPFAFAAPDRFEFAPGQFHFRKTRRAGASDDVHAARLPSAAVNHDPVVDVLLPVPFANGCKDRKAGFEEQSDRVEIEIAEAVNSKSMFAERR